MPATAAIFGAERIGTDSGRGSNTKGSENIITNGSKIVVPEGIALLTFQDGAITGCVTEPGGEQTVIYVNLKEIPGNDLEHKLKFTGMMHF